MANLCPLIRFREFDSNGDPLSGGKLYSYEAGTTTPKATYTDSTGNTANANPVILDSSGYADLWLGAGAYKFVLKDANDVTLWTKDNISNSTVENGFSTGDVKLTIKSVADTGWVLMDDKTIGSASSGATGRANDDTEDLYTLLWNNVLDAWAPVTSGRGASAAADFAANKPLKLPRALGRALGISGAGSGLTSRVLGSYLGAEEHQLTSAEMPSHTHTQNSHTHDIPLYTQISTDGHTLTSGASGRAPVPSGGPFDLASDSVAATNQNTGGDGAHNNMQPTLFLNAMIKL